jgi:hypothetical protein
VASATSRYNKVVFTDRLGRIVFVQRIIYAFRFIKICFSLAIKHPRLQKSWFYLWMGGISLTILWFVPLGAVVVFLGLSPLGIALMGSISVLLLFSLLVWGEVVGLETCRAFNGLIQGDPAQPEPEMQRRQFRRWQDVFVWVLSLPGLEVIHLLRKIFRSQMAANLDWLGASYLMLPVLSLEDLSLREATIRIKQMLQDHLLRFHPDLVGISPVAGMTQWFLFLVGGLLGFLVGLVMADPLSAAMLSRLLAAAVGTILAGVLATLGIFFSSFSRACYYTTLYHWALGVETARTSGDPDLGRPPDILTQVMRKTTSSKKE